MPREPIEIAAMKLCDDLSTQHDAIGVVGLEHYWDHVLTSGAREVYRRAARNAHAALIDHDARKRIAEYLRTRNQFFTSGPDTQVTAVRDGAGNLVALKVADLRAMVEYQPEQSDEESMLRQQESDFYGLGTF